MSPSRQHLHRAIGALVGAAVGDALGAPFEFQPAGTYRRRFPEPVVGGTGEMIGGGGFGWGPGEFTDDTQMAVLVAESLLDSDGLDEDDLCRRFRAWYASDPPDVGITTGAALRATDCRAAAEAYHRSHPHGSASNGSLMRTIPAAVFFARQGTEATMDAARRISAVTHADPAAQEGCALDHELVRVALDGGDVLARVLELRDQLGPEHARFREVLSPDWAPDDATRNGPVWGALGTAVWAVRTTSSFEDAVVTAVDAGDDADTVGAITGGLAGAIYGAGAIPSRWATYVHGTVLDRTYDLADLQDLARRLAGSTPVPLRDPEPCLGATAVRPWLRVGNLSDARDHDGDVAVISLCRPQGLLTHRPVRREAYLIDQVGDHNPALEAVLADVLATIAAFRDEGRNVLVHCHGGRSRTGFVLRAWLISDEGLSYDAALAEAQRLWPHVATYNDTFEAALRDLATQRGQRT